MKTKTIDEKTNFLNWNKKNVKIFEKLKRNESNKSYWKTNRNKIIINKNKYSFFCTYYVLSNVPSAVWEFRERPVSDASRTWGYLTERCKAV